MTNNTQLSQRLAFSFLTKVKPFETTEQGAIKAPEGYKRLILEQTKQLLDGGTGEDVLLSCIRTFEGTTQGQEAPDWIFLLQLVGVEAKLGIQEIDESNLMKPGRFYYHPLLQEHPPLPRFIFNEETMDVEQLPQEDLFLEMKERFSLEDLMLFYFQRVPLDGPQRSRARAQMKKMLETNDLDFLMYLIDEGSAVAEDANKPKPLPFHLQNYYLEATQAYEKRIEVLIEGGLTNVIPKQR